eukprot:7754247-Alexandrium_andersonii.AAC.1
MAEAAVPESMASCTPTGRRAVSESVSRRWQHGQPSSASAAERLAWLREQQNLATPENSNLPGPPSPGSARTREPPVGFPPDVLMFASALVLM